MSAELEKQGRRGRRRQVANNAIENEENIEESTEERILTAKKGRATLGRRNTDEDPEKGFIGRLAEYINGVRSELDKVTWPSRPDTIRLTRIVLIVTVIAALVLGVISLGLTELFRLGLESPIIFIVIAILVAGLYIAYSRWYRSKVVDTTFSSRL